jgi:hypothetical protein
VLLAPAVAAFAAVALITVGLRVDVFDPDHPRQTTLNYALDADRGAAMWLSAGRRPPEWTRRYVTGETDDVGERFPGPLTQARHSGPAPVAAVPPPTVTVIENRSTGATRILQLRISSGGGRRLDVVADTAGHHVAATVQGHAVHAAPPRPRSGRWNWAFTFEAVPATGIDVTLTVRGEGPPAAARVVLPRRSPTGAPAHPTARRPHLGTVPVERHRDRQELPTLIPPPNAAGQRAASTASGMISRSTPTLRSRRTFADQTGADSGQAEPAAQCPADRHRARRRP